MPFYKSCQVKVCRVVLLGNDAAAMIALLLRDSTGLKTLHQVCASVGFTV
jgi:hypothetical protein